MSRRSPAGRAHAPRTARSRSAQKGPLTAMQIRLTVLGPRSGHQASTAPAGCDVLVTAPAGTALAAVASGLAATVGGPDTGGTVVLYAGSRRLDLQRAVLGEPPLVDGAVLALHAPAADADADAGVPLGEGPGAPQLHVVAGPDAGGVHLLHPGAVRIGRSADADVPLDDPDVSRLHCAVTVMPDGRVAVADLGSTNGTTLDGAPVGVRAVPLPPGALLRIGESTLRLAAGSARPLPVTPDQEGHLSLPTPSAGSPGPARRSGSAAPGTDPETGGRAPAGRSAAAGPGQDPQTGGGPGAARRAGAFGEGPGSGGSGARESFPHPAPSRNGGSAPDPDMGLRPGTPRPGTPGTGDPGAGDPGAGWHG
ncbi:FHA domain-containing protein, partial [Streptomyces sp. NPDC059564]|uniref:FHA domain-containing protein n=1 Tax=Streptomyces sp. NPDC059564 TaxID=3346865 RepID=UPI003685823A